MDFSWVTRNTFVILPLLVILSISPLSSSLSPTDKVTKQLLDQLCSKPSIYTHFCSAWLTSDPITFTLDLQGLVGSVFEKTELLGLKNLATMKGLARTTTDPELKLSYGSCVTDYEAALKAIESATEFVSGALYYDAVLVTLNTINSVIKCDTQLEGEANVPAYVPFRNDMIIRMCNIGMAFANAIRS